MIQSKRINIIVAIAIIFSLIISIAFVVIGKTKEAQGSFVSEAEYATKIFGTDIITVEIIADEDDWKEMLDNAISEQYIMADVIVNGTKFQNVGVRPKGNSSLTQVSSSDSDRYSFRLQFNEYIKDQTCFGLESFVVNNILGDNTYMKEYVSYELMQEIGVDAPYFGYADVSVNGEGWGLYLAVELYNENYEQRVFGDTSGMLYNVKSMDMGGNKDENAITMPSRPGNITQRPNDAFIQGPGGQQSFQGSNGEQQFTPPDSNAMTGFNAPPNTDNATFPPQRGSEGFGMDKEFGMDKGFGGGGRGSSGGSLEYIDDNTESYSAIFNNVVGKGAEEDYQRVIQALEALSEGKDLERYLDVDQILRYLAAHTIVVNLDSYSSNMAQNYYLYENDGRLTILPWDYNLAWGGFQNSSASSVINFPIDTPVSGVEMSSRPLIEKLFENTEYLKRYHSYLQQLIDEYFVDGQFEEKINMLDALISEYVKNDSTAFCTYEEYKKAVSAFIKLGNLRAESVQGQLNGTVPSTTEEQNSNADKLISAGDLNVSDLGSMMGGGNNRGFFDNMGAPGGMGENSGNRTPPDNFNEFKQWGQNTNNQMRPAEGTSEEQPQKINSFIFIGALWLFLIAAILFVARFKKSY